MAKLKANFLYFKASGKYYSEADGFVPDTNEVWSRTQLLEANGNFMPGLSTTGANFIIVVIPDEGADKGWPQLKLIGVE